MKTNSDSDADSKYLKSLLLTLNEKYSGDVGLFNIYFLNYVVLQVLFCNLFIYWILLFSPAKQCFCEQICPTRTYRVIVSNVWPAQIMLFVQVSHLSLWMLKLYVRCLIIHQKMQMRINLQPKGTKLSSLYTYHYFKVVWMVSVLSIQTFLTSQFSKLSFKKANIT